MEKSKEAALQVLLVEDAPGDVRLIIEAFKHTELDTQLHVAWDGAEALRYLWASPPESPLHPDLILLDLNIPLVNGHEVLAQIKSHPDLKKIPVVVLSSSQLEEDISKAYQSYANSYVMKPVDLHDYFKAVQLIEKFWLDFIQLPPK